MSDVILLPGMGADGRLFAAHASQVSFDVPEWPSHREGESLPAFAERVAARLPSVPQVVGGASFGGMVSLELARIVGAKAVVLMGSCREPAQVAPMLRFLGHVAPVVPAACFRVGGWNRRVLASAFGPLNAQQASVLFSMAEASSPSFIKWACRAVLEWSPGLVGVPVFQIHGDRDRIIPVHRVQATEVIPGAGHLLNVTHAAEVTAFLQHVVEARR